MSNQYAALMRKGVKLPPEAKDKTGRLARHVPNDEDRERVRVLAGNGCAEDVIAKVLHIALMTLRKHYMPEIEDGRAIVTALMGAALVREGMAGNVAAQRFWLATRGGAEWQLAKDDWRFNRHGLPGDAGEDGVVHFYMPPNGRDEPEKLEPPTIEGEAEPDAA